MTTPTLTCETCEDPIDVAQDPRCVIYDPSGATEVVCAECRQREHDKWLIDLGAFGTAVTYDGKHVPLSRVKRGWLA